MVYFNLYFSGHQLESILGNWSLTWTPGRPPIHALVACDPDMMANFLNKASSAEKKRDIYFLSLVTKNWLLHFTYLWQWRFWTTIWYGIWPLNSRESTRTPIWVFLKWAEHYVMILWYLHHQYLVAQRQSKVNYTNLRACVRWINTLGNDCNIRSLHAGKNSTFRPSVGLHAFMPL